MRALPIVLGPCILASQLALAQAGQDAVAPAQPAPQPSTAESGAPPSAPAATESAPPPATSGTQPATTGIQPATSGTQPATSGTQPATSGTQPATSGTQPATTSATSAAPRVLPGRTVTERQSPIPGPWDGELTPVTNDETLEYQGIVDEFGAGARDFRQEISDLVQAQYRERRSRLRDEYEDRIRLLEEEESRKRLTAIQKFQKFIDKYPHDPMFTPGAIFRLAELYFEQSQEDYRLALKKYDEDVAAFDRGDLKIEPEQPTQHYEKTIALYQRLITEFPNYELIDGAYYLLGFCLSEQNEQDQAVVQFLELTRKYPKSRFFSESWMRVGEYYFDNDKLPEAIAAYQSVLLAKDSPYYDKALYKLGWTHYRLNNYDEAITRFMQVLDYSQQKKAEGVVDGSDLEPESLQYIAVSLSDDNWDRGIAYDPFEDENGDKMVAFAEDYLKKMGGRPYETDIFVRLGDILFDASKYPGAVRSYEYALKLTPLSPDAPNYQDKIVQSWERARDFESSSRARDQLVANFSEGTPWYNANRENVEALRNAANLARTSLYTSAIFHHQQAQKYVSQDKYDLAKVEFEQAARGYGQYLQRFPHDKNSYELNWYLADTLYNSLQFKEASVEYARVRDSNAGSKYRGEAALNVVFSMQKVIEQAEKDGQIVVKAPLDPKNRPENLPPPEDIPALKQELIIACDKAAERAPNDEKVPALKLLAAEQYFVYAHYDEARPRLEEVLDKYPDKDVAKIAANYILEYLLTKKDWSEVEKFAIYVKKKRGSTDDKENDELTKIELGALFQKAKQYMDEGTSLIEQSKTTEGNKRLEEAASEYVRLVEQNPTHEFADKALFNAAVAYGQAKRYDAALKLYERVYKEYGKSDLASKALWRVADSAYNSYDFDKAIVSYQELVKKYPESDKRADAQYNAALALENLQQYDKAAKAYEEYAKLFPSKEDAPAVFYRAAAVHEKRGDQGATVATLKRFLDKYKKDPAQTDMVVESMTRLGDIALAQGKQKEAEDYYKQAVREFASRKGNPQSPAGYQAAKARFRLAEFELTKYEKLKIDGKANAQVKALQAKSKVLKEMEKEYAEVLPYKQLEWSLAAAYRLGYLYENLSESVLAAQCPADVKKVGGDEACDEYRVMLEEKLSAPLEQKAKAAYEIANKQAEEQKFQNEWTRKTLEALHKYDPATYPIDKEPRRKLVGDQQVGLDVQGGNVVAAPQKKLGGK